MAYEPRDENGTSQTNIQVPSGGNSGAAMFAIGLVVVAIALLVWFFVANNDNDGATQTSQPTATTVPMTQVPTTLPDATTTPAP